MVIQMKSTTIILNLDNLGNNINYYSTKYNKKIMAVVKNNAYGHGIKEISTYLDTKKEVSYLVCNTLKEGLYLRKLKITKPILILGTIEKKDLEKTLNNNLTISITNLKLFYELLDLKYQGKVHININTGMNRLGITPFEFKRIINSSLNIEGIYTHYIGGNDDITNIKKQQETFHRLIKSIN